jgi:hypothetical protein
MAIKTATLIEPVTIENRHHPFTSLFFNIAERSRFKPIPIPRASHSSISTIPGEPETKRSRD